MGRIQSHIQQWTHNRAFLGTISGRYPDWRVTVSFYIALQAVDALLAHDQMGSRVTSHESRNMVLAQTNRYRQVAIHYFPLHDMSRTVRYLADPGKWIPTEEIEPKVLHRYLYPIEASVQRLIGIDLQFGKIVMPS